MAGSVHVQACKPEELFLAVSQVEKQLAWESVNELNRRRKNLLKIPIGVFLIMSEQNILKSNEGWYDCQSFELGIW